MATIEQARADRARDALNRTIEHQEIAQQESQASTAKADEARAVIAKGDGIDGNDATKAGLAPSTPSENTGIAHTAAGPNPFASLARGGAGGDSVLVLAEALPLGTELAPEVEQMVHLGALEAGAFKQSASGLQTAADKVRTGTLLLLADDASAAHEKLGESQSSANELAGTLLDHASADSEQVGTIISQHVMASEIPAGMDINAYVEQVLREAYMIQQGVLKDYADQMSAINDQRKKYRDQLAKQRNAKAKVASGERLTAEDLEALGITLTDEDLASLEDDGSTSADGSDETASPQSSGQSATAGAYNPPPWSPSLASGFGQVLIADPSGTQGVLDYAATYSGEREADRYAHQKKDPSTLLTALAQGGATRPVGELDAIIGAALYGVDNGQNVEGNKGFIVDVINDMTYDQLTGLASSDPQLWTRMNVATGDAGDQRLQQLTEIRSAGLEGSDPGSDHAVQLFALAQTHDFASPWMEQALAAMHGLDTGDAIDALKTIATGSSTPISAATFDQFFFACDPAQLLKNNADHTSLDFVLAFKGQAADAVDRWNGVPAGRSRNLEVSTTTATMAATKQASYQTSVHDGRSTSAVLSGGFKSANGAQTATPAVTDAAVDANTAPADSTAVGTTLPASEVDSILASASADNYKTLIGDKLDNLVSDTQDQLDSAGGDAETMQLQLQDALQKSQELMQMMSNMSKVIHDTVMSVIRNIGG